MKNEIMTEKERDILFQYIWHENYLANPSKIETDTKKSVTRAWANKICRQFYEYDIFNCEMIKPRRYKYETEHYSLRKDKEAFSKIFQLFLTSNHYKFDSINFLQSPYANSVINKSFVRKILSEKGVEIRRIIELEYWNNKEGEDLFNLFKKNYSGRNSKKIESLSYSDYKVLKTNNKNQKMKIGLNFFSSQIHLRLPIYQSESINDKEIQQLLKLNKEMFKKYKLQLRPSGIKHHYNTWLDQKLILPILALIRTSPQALSEFLFGDWADDEIISDLRERKTFDNEGFGMVEHLLYRLIFKAIADYAIYRWGINVYGNMVNYACVRPKYEFEEKDKKDVLLELVLNDGSIIYYDAGFDTAPPMVYGEELIEIPPVNPEDCWVQIEFEEPKSFSKLNNDKHLRSKTNLN